MTIVPGADQDDGRLLRRRFLRFLAGFSVASTAAMIATPVVSFLIPAKTSGGAVGGKVLVGTISDIPIGQGKVVPVGGRPTIVVNTEQGVKAYLATCTHLGCIVAWDQNSRTIACPCHDGRFNVSTGAVISGPPPSGLPAVQVSVEGEQIYVVSG